MIVYFSCNDPFYCSITYICDLSSTCVQSACLLNVTLHDARSLQTVFSTTNVTVFKLYRTAFHTFAFLRCFFFTPNTVVKHVANSMHQRHVHPAPFQLHF